MQLSAALDSSLCTALQGRPREIFCRLLSLYPPLDTEECRCRLRMSTLAPDTRKRTGTNLYLHACVSRSVESIEELMTRLRRERRERKEVPQNNEDCHPTIRDEAEGVSSRVPLFLLNQPRHLYLPPSSALSVSTALPTFVLPIYLSVCLCARAVWLSVRAFPSGIA